MYVENFFSLLVMLGHFWLFVYVEKDSYMPALGRGVLQQQQPGMRTPVCGGCQAPIRCLFRLFCILIDGISYYARHLSGVALDYFVS